jgi:UDP-N-acetylglucosamine:LPS N-acetylglucosamine transferase
LIPFPLAKNDHQRTNAEFLANKVGGATMLLQEEAIPCAVDAKIDLLLQKRAEWKKNLALFRMDCEGRSSFAEQIMALGKAT